MGSWRNQNQVGNWSRSSSFYNRNPPLVIWWKTVARWEKRFCATIGSFPWQKLVETKRYINIYDNVMNWDDSAGREAFHNEKTRFWAAMNGYPYNVPLPDPDIYIGDIDWNSNINPELILDLERDPVVPNEEQRDQGIVILDSHFLLNGSFFCIGWGDAEPDAPNQHENGRGGALEDRRAPDEVGKVYEWQSSRNGYWGGNQREHYHRTDAYRAGKGRGGWNRGRWSMSWKRYPAYYRSDEYETNRGLRNYRRGRKGTFSPAAW